jgi:hypothetical protein
VVVNYVIYEVCYVQNSQFSRLCILGEYTVSAEELKNGDTGFNETAPDRSTSQAGTSVAGTSTHSSKKSDDGGYVQ